MSGQTEISIIPILQKALEGAEEDKEKIRRNLKKIRANRDQLKLILDKPYYGNSDEEIPGEFSDPQKFLKLWDDIDRALGNTILMVMPPSIFQTADFSSPEKTEESKPASPVIVMSDRKKEQPTRQAVRGFFSGVWDYRIEKLKTLERKADKPIITTSKVTYNPKDIVYQLIPSLNEIKELYFKFLRRHQSSRAPSVFLVKLGHMRLQEKMSKYFNVIYPFCNASIIFQIEKIRRDKLQQLTSFTQVAQAQAMAQAGSVTYEITRPVSPDGFTLAVPKKRKRQ